MHYIIKIFLLNIFLILSFVTIGQHEICGDGIDNDNDGSIDEVCQPFECDGSLYQSARDNNDFILYKVDVNPVQFTFITNLSQNGNLNSFNSLAYNPLDNLMYGMGTTDSKIYRIDANGNVEFLGNVNGLNSFFINGGTFDNLGNYYVFGDNILRKIDIANLSLTTIGGTGTYGSADIVFNPVDNQIYGWSGNPKLLFKINPNTGSQTIIPGNAPLAINSWGWTGAMYFNAQGDILGYQGTKMIKINPSTGIGLQIGTGPSKSSNDGCSCSFGVEMTKSVTGSFMPGDTISYHFEFFNQSFSAITNSLSFDDMLTGGFQWTSNPYNLVNIQLSGNTNTIGNTNANFSIDNLPQGKSSFSIDARIPCNYTGTDYTNQAVLSNLPLPLKDTILSDNPNSLAIGDPTTFTLISTPLSTNPTTTNIICDQNTGTIELNANGGSQPLSYLWDNGQTNSLATGLSAGIHTVTITDSYGCEIVLSDQIFIENITLTNYFNTENVQCNGQNNGSLTIDSTIGGYEPYQYSLDGITYNSNIQFDNLSAGNHMLYTLDNYGCNNQIPFTLTEPTFLLAIQAPNDTIMRIGEQLGVNIQQNTNSQVGYQWTPTTGLSCSNCANPIINITESTTYTIIGMDIQGCYDTTSFSIEVIEETRVFIPNAFSPNNNGVNDILMIFSPGDVEKVKSFRIFDRWGEMVFNQNNFPPNTANYGWDGSFRGKQLNPGVYVYSAELLLIDGRTVIVNGDITLFR
ncbi:MAG: gliding motility-associated C-terminal domain-containing protein [Saprospiraceae bacterium]|nr:gliding motility-associated C-terminal domain-containing protein [Saprospiraceae bacterium]